MKRIIQLATIAICAGFTASAQDLAYKIPETAFSVATLKTDQLFQLTSVTDFDKSMFGVKLLQKLSSLSAQQLNSVNDLGVNLGANMYYYYQLTDSINYSGVLIPLSDAKKVEALLAQKHEDIQKIKGISIIQQPSENTIMAWNDQMLYLTYGNVNERFFRDSAVSIRYGIDPELMNAATDVVTDLVADTITAVDISEDSLADSAAAIADSAILATDPDAYVLDSASAAIVDEPSIETTENDAWQQERDEAYEEKKRTMDSLSLIWLTNTTLQIFDKTAQMPSVLGNPGFQRSMDKNALASFWMTDIQRIYTTLLPYYFMKYGAVMRGYGSFNARLYMGKDDMRITSELGLDREKAAMYHRITDHKLSKKFLNYVNSDSLIAFMSYSINTEAYMDELPKLLRGIYGKYDEEMDIATDLISLFLDEKAVAKVVKGDALFILSNITEKQVSYSSYAYDEETYEYKDTILTKTESLPDFLCMFSSDDTQLFEKMLQYGIRKGKVNLQNNIYTIGRIGKNPLTMHLLIKNGIVFIGTSLSEISRINEGTFKANVEKRQKELLTKNNMTVFFNPKNIGTKMPTKELGESTEKLSKLLGGAGNVYMSTAGIKDGYVGLDLTADVPKEKENALKYFFDMIEEMGKLK